LTFSCPGFRPLDFVELLKRLPEGVGPLDFVERSERTDRIVVPHRGMRV
jgi:hypothetical protein